MDEPDAINYIQEQMLAFRGLKERDAVADDQLPFHEVSRRPMAYYGRSGKVVCMAMVYGAAMPEDFLASAFRRLDEFNPKESTTPELINCCFS